jgi:NAD(P)-dependent dehydrogenase (short-subunit alcohol dehydrogenase family)
MVSFEGQAVIVTGAGRGLGRLYALDLASRGASVVVNDVGSTMRGGGSDAAVADLVVDEITAAGGSAVASHDPVDSPEGARAIVASAVEAFGRLDAVVSNAGIYGITPFEDITADEFRRMRSVHVDGAFFVAQAAYRTMKEQGYGRFVMISSSAGMFGQSEAAHYSAAKAGVFGLVNAIAAGGVPHGILANAVLPFGQSRMVWESHDGDGQQPSNPFIDAIVPELVVPMVSYLASSACTVTHQNFSVGGGRYARVFVGLGHGWVAPKRERPTAEDIEANLGAITATDPYSIPLSLIDDVFDICQRIGLADP